MGFSALEQGLMRELRVVTGNRALREKDLLEWSSSEEQVKKNLKDRERMIHCPNLGLWAAIPAAKAGK